MSDLLRKAFSFPAPEELQTIDEFNCSCRTCGATWTVVMRDHIVTRGTANALLAHADSHKPGRPGLRRTS